MFKLTDETRTVIIAMLRDKFNLTQSDDEINAVVDEIVDAVKRQFGM